ncbi:hypothetical protein DYB28_001300 [Aphanomyces astaci]|uniref:Uncharacterized protein n=1 Tax=Aphanomyces astaci TaxID=112090 RepID=A0A9X8E321_APHAT|nr:hypothetical protein DYB28_001300 [Aphanomyces astaci]
MDLLARIKVAMADAKTPIQHLPTLDDAPSNPLLPTATGDGPLPPPPPRKPVARKDKLEHGTPMLGGQPLNVHMRDIRKLDNAFAIGNKPSITVRRQGILVNADPVRAVITRDACVVFLQDGAHDLIPELEVNFKDHLDECSVHGFEALEAILATLCT